MENGSGEYLSEILRPSSDLT